MMWFLLFPYNRIAKMKEGFAMAELPTYCMSKANSDTLFNLKSIMLKVELW